MPNRTVLITGACGEIGQALIKSLYSKEHTTLVTVDLKPLPEKFKGKTKHIVGNLLNKDLLSSLENEYDFSMIFHLAAILSTIAEHDPLLAHQVNTCSTIDLLEIAARQSREQSQPVKFLFPSSIAVYGLPDLETKNRCKPVKESEWNNPTTMYGCSKLYCEKVGNYYSEYYQQLADQDPVRLDFRALRFPGIISAYTIPSGGTSDFGPEMIHFAAQGKSYDCFVREDVRIPFMVMPDAVRSLQMLAEVPKDKLQTRIYNVTSFSFSAQDFKDLAQNSFPGSEINFKPDPKRQAIVDTWPADIDDSAARKDWSWQPEYGIQESCQEYLLKNISNLYNIK
ncbi:MAG: NAD-dependent epimerase/dehydratase family protein [Anaerolineales bacterium]|nr:NAD-dependent epimerase/dehydratase family protein [Anaerolineales bacterium]